MKTEQEIKKQMEQIKKKIISDCKYLKNKIEEIENRSQEETPIYNSFGEFQGSATHLDMLASEYMALRKVLREI